MTRIETLNAALADLDAKDLDELSLDDLDALIASLSTWEGLAWVAAMKIRLAEREER